MYTKNKKVKVKQDESYLSTRTGTSCELLFYVLLSILITCMITYSLNQ